MTVFGSFHSTSTISSVGTSFSFDLQLENWGVDVNALKTRTVKRVFRAWERIRRQSASEIMMWFLSFGCWRSMRALIF
jgi:hypothetical protein